MKILAIEFSSERRSVALVETRAGEDCQLRGMAEEIGGRNAHAFALIEQVLEQAKTERKEITCIAVGVGPGSYAGIRAAIALAQGWQLARDIFLLGISSVECLAAQVQANGTRGPVNLIVDAQRNEFYLAKYELDENRYTEMEPLHLASRAEVEKRIAAGETVIGPDAGGFGNAKELFPSAAALGRLACGRRNFVAGEKLEPIYLRETSFVKAPPPRVI